MLYCILHCWPLENLERINASVCRFFQRHNSAQSLFVFNWNSENDILWAMNNSWSFGSFQMKTWRRVVLLHHRLALRQSWLQFPLFWKHLCQHQLHWVGSLTQHNARAQWMLLTLGWHHWWLFRSYWSWLAKQTRSVLLLCLGASCRLLETTLPCAVGCRCCELAGRATDVGGYVFRTWSVFTTLATTLAS